MPRKPNVPKITRTPKFTSKRHYIALHNTTLKGVLDDVNRITDIHCDEPYVWVEFRETGMGYVVILERTTIEVR